jgi:hypothetical protein
MDRVEIQYFVIQCEGIVDLVISMYRDPSCLGVFRWFSPLLIRIPNVVHVKWFFWSPFRSGMVSPFDQRVLCDI